MLMTMIYAFLLFLMKTFLGGRGVGVAMATSKDSLFSANRWIVCPELENTNYLNFSAVSVLTKNEN